MVMEPPGGRLPLAEPPPPPASEPMMVIGGAHRTSALLEVTVVEGVEPAAGTV